MPKRDNTRLYEQIIGMADRLTEGEESKGSSQLAIDLRQGGMDPDALKKQFYKAATAIASRERANGRPAPLALQQAIEQMGPENVLPSDNKAAETKMDRWFSRLSAPFVLPDDLEAVRAFRKGGNLANDEQADLDELEQRLKEEIKKEDEEQT